MKRSVCLLLPLGVVLLVASACGVTSDLGGDVPTITAVAEDPDGGLDAGDTAAEASTSD